jgi:hypothetical protein
MSSTIGPQSTLTAGASSFLERQLTVTFYIRDGQSDNFTESTFAGCRISATVVHSGLGQSPVLSALIYGLPPAFMNSVSNLGTNPARLTPNKIRLTAGDAVNGFSQVYFGSLYVAFVDTDGAPDIALNVQSVALYDYSLMPIPATSFKGIVPVATIMQAIASQIGFKFLNNGVTATLGNPYFHGTVMNQLQDCADAANCTLNTFAMMQGIVEIVPVGQPITTGPTPLISASTGMIGYPSYASTGITVRCVYNPAIVLCGLIKIESIFPQATGSWVVATLTHTLESLTPDGLWETEIQALYPWSVPQ